MAEEGTTSTLVFCLALLLLGVGAARAAESSDPWLPLAPEGEQPTELHGAWENPATGHWIHFSSDGTEVVHVLGDLCLRDPGLVPPFSLYRLSPNRSELELHYFDYRRWPQLLQAPQVYESRRRFPESCGLDSTTAVYSPSEVFDLAVASFDRFYAVFEDRDFRWSEHKATFFERARGLENDDQLFDLLVDLLRPLNDGHVNLTLADRSFNAGRPALRQRLARHWSETQTDLDEGAWVSSWHRAVLASVHEVLDEGSLRSGAAGALDWGTIDQTVGYVRIHRFGGFTEEPASRGEQYAKLEAALRTLRADLEETTHWIVDVAMNGGGSDAAALLVTSHLAARERHVLSYETRGGRRQDVRVKPATPGNARPVFLLTSEITASAAESFVLMLRALPHVTHVGGTTRGGLSSLLPKPLPNGSRITISYQRVLDSEGRAYEGRGIPPEREIELFPDDDLHGSFAKAVGALGHELAREAGATALPLIPAPVELEQLDGSFVLSERPRVVFSPEARNAAEAFDREVESDLQVDPALQADSPPPNRSIRFLVDPSIEEREGAYQLEVRPDSVDIRSATGSGAFNGAQTLLQLLPEDGSSKIEALRIVDAPRFAWRGLMLDSARHFFTVEEVKGLLDQMAAYKFNVFHWHLTDDQGWRIEILSRPRLTEIGAWRVPREGIWWFRDPPQEGEAATYGGFYSQDQIREVVAYAAARNIMVVPEIDVPGHSMAALAAYPELSTTGGPFQVTPGSLFYNDIENTLDPSNPETYRFLEDVISEVADLFPGPYIHVGGDECTKVFWAESSQCRALMEREGLEDLEQLQSYFIRRVAGIVHSHGKRLIGWDEILEGGLAEGAIVMSWRGTEGGVKAATMGHPVIMTPSPAYYLDLYQGHPSIEPATYGMARLIDTYQFDPSLPEDLDPSLLMGIQGNLWSEEIPNFRHLQYMAWPRALAIAETAWTPAERTRNWPDFVRRVEHHFERFDARDWNYARSIYDPAVRYEEDESGQGWIRLTTEIEGLTIHYTFDDTEPDHHYPAYGGPLRVPRNAFSLRTRTYRNGEPIGRLTDIRLSEIEKEKKTP